MNRVSPHFFLSLSQQCLDSVLRWQLLELLDIPNQVQGVAGRPLACQERKLQIRAQPFQDTFLYFPCMDAEFLSELRVWEECLKPSGTDLNCEPSNPVYSISVLMTKDVGRDPWGQAKTRTVAE